MSKLKIIAFYLPQFHAIPENDKWWGKGFTEWVNTKKAKPLFKEHQQPKTPLNDNYYNLLDSKTQEWQAKLAKENDVHGFCYYHYWFNGKMLLEKPMENMLKNKNVDLPFCISWANEPWARTWDGKDTEVLMPQSYGGEEEWKAHFNYLIKFFNDDRYIKVDNKPLFLIYRTSNIPNCDKMVEFWDELCKENGFNGIYLVETLNSFQKEGCLQNSSAYVEFEPMLTIRRYMPYYKQGIRFLKKKLQQYGIKTLDILSYDYIWKQIIKRNVKYDKKVFYGAFVDWDNTARKKEKGLILKGASPEKFSKYLRYQINKSIENNSEFVFVNAWNEWAEGTYLEPDTLNENLYLEKIKKEVTYEE